jgi:hypothetical protein
VLERLVSERAALRGATEQQKLARTRARLEALKGRLGR